MATAGKTSRKSSGNSAGAGGPVGTKTKPSATTKAVPTKRSGLSRVLQRPRRQVVEERRPASGRYTPPIPRSVKRSPGWYPWVLLTLLVAGVLCIILNYIEVLPSSPTNWYVLGGLIAILAAALMATAYR